VVEENQRLISRVFDFLFGRYRAYSEWGHAVSMFCGSLPLAACQCGQYRRILTLGAEAPETWTAIQALTNQVGQKRALLASESDGSTKVLMRWEKMVTFGSSKATTRAKRRITHPR
jgi:hypothetical protein